MANAILRVVVHWFKSLLCSQKKELPGFEIPVEILLNSIDCDLADVIVFKFG